MSDPQSSNSGQAVNEIKQVTTFEDLENGVTLKIDLRPGLNHLVLRVRGQLFFFST